MELDFIENSDNVEVSTVREVEVLVHQEPLGVTSAILVTEQAPTLNTMVCATISMCVSLPLQGPTEVCCYFPEYKCWGADAHPGQRFAASD